MRIIAKQYEVMRGEKSDLIDSGYKKLGTKVQNGVLEDGKAYIETTGRRAGLKKTHTDPAIISKFFNMSIRPEKGLEFDDNAIIKIAKDIDGTISKLLSAGGVYTELFKELKNAKAKFLLTVVLENNANIDSMMGLDNRRGYFMEKSKINTDLGQKIIALPQIVIKASYDNTGRPLLRPEQQKLVLIHELMHHFDLVFSSKSASVKKLVTALRKKPIYTSQYSHTNDKEMIAELLAYYYLKASYSEYAEQFKQLEDLASSIKIKVKR